MSNLPKHYRYDACGDENGEAHIYVTTWVAIRETPCGYYVVPDWLYCGHPSGPERYGKSAKWVSKTSRKRRCYPDKVQAFESFKVRKQRHIERLRYDLRIMQSALDKASSYPEGAVPEEPVQTIPLLGQEY